MLRSIRCWFRGHVWEDQRDTLDGEPRWWRVCHRCRTYRSIR